MDLNQRSFYFLHSFMAYPFYKEHIIAKCKYYDIDVPAIVKKKQYSWISISSGKKWNEWS